MNNFFISTKAYGSKPKSTFVRLINKGLRYFKLGYHLEHFPDGMRDMNTLEQRINYFHLLTTVLNNGIEGDVIELGVFTGQCAMLFQKIIQDNNSDKQLRLYDAFHISFKEKGSEEDKLKQNFKDAGLNEPVLHKGFFQDTLPSQLPEKIAFVHIDCGFGGNKMEHKEILIFCLTHIYPRMTKGAICVMMDYFDKSIEDNHGWAANPGVKLACDDFFAGRPEKMISLYGNEYHHGYFIKQ